MKLDGVFLYGNSSAARLGAVEFGTIIENVEMRGGEYREAPGDILIPGLVELHSHGAMGFDHSDGTEEALRAIASFYLRNGVTSFLATTMTGPREAMRQASETAGRRLGERPGGGARLAGVNMEGPFLSAAKKGAHAEEYLHKPDIGFFQEMNQAAKGGIRLLSVAPETDGAISLIREVRATSSARVSVAHTAADYETAAEAFREGATHLTHLFNAMPSFLHREPGPIGAAMDAGAWAEVICDGFHLHPSVVRAAFKLFPERVCLISDSIRSAGLPDGHYVSGGLPIVVRDGKALLEDGTIAGSNISLYDGLVRAVQFGVPPGEAIHAATLNPARAIGLENEIGTIREGARADFLLLDKNLGLKAVFIDGKETGS